MKVLMRTTSGREIDVSHLFARETPGAVVAKADDVSAVTNAHQVREQRARWDAARKRLGLGLPKERSSR